MVRVARKRSKPVAKKQAPRPWWGDGQAPHEQWPGVTIEIPCAWSKARERWESPDGRYYFDPEAAARAEDFFPEFLRHHRGQFAGARFTLLEYQSKLIVRPVFGWLRASDGLRRFRKVFLAVPKGSGKSPLCSGLLLYLLLADGEEGAECYAAAADREQAGIVFNTAKTMVEASPALSSRCSVYRRAIEAPATHSIFRVLSADAAVSHGLNVHGLGFDEFHAQPDRELYEALHRGTVKRRQPLTVLVTTAGDDDESVCAEEWDFAGRVRSGTIPDETYLPVIFAADAADDWTDPEVWKRTNPGWGVTVQPEAIEVEARAAQAEPRKRNDFLRFHLNRWVAQATAWIPVDWWDACAGRLPADAELAEVPVAAGVDLAQKIDLAAVTLAFRLPLQGNTPAVEVVTGEGPDARRLDLNYRVAFMPFFWLPEETLEQRVKQDGVPYDLWAEAGLLRVTPGAIIDSDAIYRTIVDELAARFPLLKQSDIAYDPAFATELALRLRGAGLRTVECLQGYRQLSEPAQVFEAMVKAKRVVHDGHRLLRWNVENVAIKTDDSGRIRPVKPRRQTRRIDGVVAGLMALSRLMVAPDRPQPAADDVLFWVT